MKLRINFNTRNDKYYIQKKTLFFWNGIGELMGTYDGEIYTDVWYFKTKEEATTRMIKHLQEDEAKQIEKNRRKLKKNNFKPVAMSTEDMRNKFPEWYL